MTTPVVLGLDVGTSSVKVVLLDRDGVEYGRGRSEYPRTELYEPGEIDPTSWWSSVRSAVTEALSGGPVSVRGIGLCGQMHGIVPLDERGVVVRPAITWADNRSISLLPEVQSLAQPFEADLINPSATGFASAIWYWLRRAEPGNARRIAWVLQPKDWIGFHLTGVMGTERTDASATGLWDFTDGRWHDGFVRALGLRREMLPDVRRGDDLRGELLTDIAAELGLPAGIPVSHGRADAAASQVGSGARVKVGTTTLTIGTGAQLCHVLRGRPEPPAPGLLTLVGPRDDQNYLMAGVFSAGLALNWVRRLWSLSWAEFLDCGLSSAAPASGPLFMPFVGGERLVDSAGHAASWFNLSGNVDRADMIRSAIDGSLYTIRLALDRLRSDPQAGPIDSCVVVGGGTRDARLRQRVADVLAVPVHSPDVVDASVRGAALSSLPVAGWCSSSEDASELFECQLSTASPDPRSASLHEQHYGTFTRHVERLTHWQPLP